ncbi:MAG: hypothetical protein AAGI91_14100 [Bacteroidota bacterium]
MPATSIRIRVDAETARAYEQASDAQKERARSVFAWALHYRNESTEETLRFFDEVARNARARGLTPEILDDILHDRPPGPDELAGPGGPAGETG